MSTGAMVSLCNPQRSIHSLCSPECMRDVSDLHSASLFHAEPRDKNSENRAPCVWQLSLPHIVASPHAILSRTRPSHGPRQARGQSVTQVKGKPINLLPCKLFKQVILRSFSVSSRTYDSSAAGDSCACSGNAAL